MRGFISTEHGFLDIKMRMRSFEMATSRYNCRQCDQITYQWVLMATKPPCTGKASFRQTCLEQLASHDGRQTE